jgi:hypothetical protein
MGKLKQQLIIQEELAQVAAESWEHSVMSEVREYIDIHGPDVFKDALFTFNKDTYRKLFHQANKVDECYLTNPK